MTAPRRGEVWLVDLGMAAKVRPALVISVPADDTDRALATRELGFDLLAFESPMYDMTVAWQRLRAGVSPREAFYLGTGTWGGWAQMQPLAVYLGEQARGSRPLLIAGFDHQHQLASLFHFADDLVRFLSECGLGGSLVNRESPEFGVLQGLAQALYQYRLVPRPDVSTSRAFLNAIEDVLVAVSAMRDEQARQWAQILRGMACHTRFVLQHPDIGICNRDKQMADNLLWLANARYPDRKIIVWAATSHAARMPEIAAFVGDSGPAMGRYVEKAFGPQSYVIAMTSYAGRGVREIVPDQHQLPEFEELMAAARSSTAYSTCAARGPAAPGPSVSSWPAPTVTSPKRRSGGMSLTRCSSSASRNRFRRQNSQKPTSRRSRTCASARERPMSAKMRRATWDSSGTTAWSCRRTRRASGDALHCGPGSMTFIGSSP
ncbi:MAG: erythromycin esterase family protein [Acidobacteria bacterium]|nr:erythromycin esterase family protein [Acidobacteriota bacterium]